MNLAREPISTTPAGTGDTVGHRTNLSRPKLLFIGSLDVAPTYGGPIQFHRHFIERNDFEFQKLVEPPQVRLSYLQSGVKWLDRITARASQTRLFPHFVALNEWRGVKKSVPDLVREARRFKPDVIATVAHGCYGFAACEVAKTLGVPLVTFFYDWWPDLTLQSRPGIAVFDWRMRKLYRQSDLAICVCEEMKTALGSHFNAPVVFPIPGNRNHLTTTVPTTRDRPRVIYLGGMTRGYGRMISALSREYARSSNRPWELAVFGEIRDWQAESVEQATKSGIYRGKRFGEEAAKELEVADIFLVVMDFEAETRRRVTTSFPSKLLDYCAHGKPIVIWAPEYASISKFATQNEFALLHTTDDPAALIEKIDLLVQDKNQMAHFAGRAASLGKTIFQPDSIHRQMVSEIQKLLKAKQ